MPELLHQLSVLFGNGEKHILHHHCMETAGGRASGQHTLHIEENKGAVLKSHHIVEKCAAIGCGVSLAEHLPHRHA